MKTSYFARYAKLELEGGISIARSAPRWVRGYRVYRKLNPGPWFRSCKSTEEYIDRYVDEILKPLDPQETYDELCALVAPHEPILLCWETPDKFCHRRLIRMWFATKLMTFVPELIVIIV